MIPSVHYFYVKTNMLADFQICISIPLIIYILIHLYHRPRNLHNCKHVKLPFYPFQDNTKQAKPSAVFGKRLYFSFFYLNYYRCHKVGMPILIFATISLRQKYYLTIHALKTGSNLLVS